MKQLTLAVLQGPTPTFDNFLPAQNVQACEALQTVPLPPTPVCLWGPAGSGKTHLLRALAHRLTGQGLRWGAFDASAPLPWSYDGTWSAVLLDDCERFTDAQQHAAFAVFVEATGHAVPVVAAAALPPVDLPVREDLRTRLGWGLVFQMTPLTDAESRTVLRRQAEQRGVVLSDEALDYLLTRFARDLGHLSGLIEQLDVFALARHRNTLTVPLIKQMLADTP